MLLLENITYSYPGQSEALKDLSIRIPKGITLLAGPNAGGKTTLLRLLAGLLTPRSGVVVDPETGTMFAPGALRDLGRMVMQDADPQLLGVTVGEDILLGRAASALGDAFAAEAAALTDRLGLGPFWSRPVATLSYGQKRKLCLVHAMLAGPKMLLLDEPFAGLDYPAARELRGFIRENRAAGLTQIISTHELEPVFDLADWLVVVKGGGACAEGEPEKVRARLGEWSVRAPGKGWD